MGGDISLLVVLLQPHLTIPSSASLGGGVQPGNELGWGPGKEAVPPGMLERAQLLQPGSNSRSALSLVPGAEAGGLPGRQGSVGAVLSSRQWSLGEQGLEGATCMLRGRTGHQGGSSFSPLTMCSKTHNLL